MICTVVGAMPESDLVIPSGSFVIAADAGYAQLAARGIEPDLTVGDFDSLGAVPQTKEVIRHPVRKDDTDMMLAVREGLRRGYTCFLLYGGIGGRLDHTLANLQTLAFLSENGVRGVLFGNGTAVTLLQNESVRLPKKQSGHVGVFCYGGQAEDVTIRGLSYCADDISITDSFPIGASNRFCGHTPDISVGRGRLLLLWDTSASEAIRFAETNFRREKK